MSAKKKRKYQRLTGLDRVDIQRGLDDNRSFGEIGDRINRPTITISNEVRRNRTFWKGGQRGQLIGAVPQAVCSRLKQAPWVCNGCAKHGTTRCDKPWSCEYSSVRAQRLSLERRQDARRGIDRTPDQMESAISIIRSDLERGMSPSQIAQGRSGELCVSQSTIYRWIANGYCGLTNLELRRKVAYRPRTNAKPVTPTSHGKNRSYAAFKELDDEQKAATCEMDTVMGRKFDKPCLLTLYLRPSKFQFVLMLPEKTNEAVVLALDGIETLIGRRAFKRLFGLILTDNGTEFSDMRPIERSKVGASDRAKVFYCDVRQSQQKGCCERNHVELRKMLPKGYFAFDSLQKRDLAVVMSHLNSQPRPSLGGLCAFDMFKVQHGNVADALFDGFGVEKVSFKKLNLTSKIIDIERRKRGEEPLKRA